MSKIGIFMADGCEEIEGLTVVDVVRRAKMEIVMLSITGKKEVTSSHGVTFLADALAEETGYEDLDKNRIELVHIWLPEHKENPEAADA